MRESTLTRMRICREFRQINETARKSAGVKRNFPGKPPKSKAEIKIFVSATTRRVALLSYIV